MQDYKHVLVAVDLRPDSTALITRAADIARRYEAMLTLLHVVETIPIDVTNEFIIPKLHEVEEELKQQADNKLATLAKLPGINTHSATLTGSPKWEILNYALERNVDLIVLGAHARRGLRRLLGATANALLHDAPCDVLVVHLGEGG